MTDENNTSADSVATPGEPKPGRSRAKSRSARWFIIALVLLIVAGAAWGGWYVYDRSQTQRDAQKQIDEATVMIENADVTVLDVDEVVRAEVTVEIGEQATELQEDVPGAIEVLEDAIVMIEDAIPDLPEDDVAHAEALIESAATRVEMLGTVDVILEANAKAAAALGPSLDAWAAVLEGERVADESIAEYNKLTDDAVKLSLELTAEAMESYEEADRLFSVAATGFPEADFSAYQAYVAGKIELLNISKKANDAFLAGEKADANDFSDEYNAKDKEFVEMAAKLPTTPGEVVANAYEQLAGEATTAYFDARERATRADEALGQLKV